jgi:hypothetical protein
VLRRESQETKLTTKSAVAAEEESK